MPQKRAFYDFRHRTSNTRSPYLFTGVDRYIHRFPRRISQSSHPVGPRCVDFCNSETRAAWRPSIISRYPLPQPTSLRQAARSPVSPLHRRVERKQASERARERREREKKKDKEIEKKKDRKTEKKETVVSPRSSWRLPIS